PEELAAQARAVREQEAALAEAVAVAREHLADAVDTRSEAERAEAEEERRLGGLLRAAADRREGLARLAGQVAARRSRVEAGQEQVDRLIAQIGEAEERAEVARAEFEALESPATALDALRLLKADDGGQASVVVAHLEQAPARPLLADTAGPPPAPGARWARSLVQAPAALSATLDRLLDAVAVVPDLDTAA